MSQTTVAIIDGDLFRRRGIIEILSDCGMDCIGSAPNFCSLLASNAPFQRLSILIVNLDDFQETRSFALMRAMIPKPRILGITTGADDWAIELALISGACALIQPSIDRSAFKKAIETITKGGFYIQPILQDRLRDWLFGITEVARDGSRKARPMTSFTNKFRFLNDLTERELDVIKLLAEGKSNNEISYFLQIKGSTVAFHTTNIIKKLRLTSRVECALLWQCYSCLRNTEIGYCAFGRLND